MATPQPIPMFGAWNEHWKNHPAGLPVSQYKPNTNPNTGAASVNSAWNAYQAASPSTNQTPPAQTNTGTGGSQTTPAPTGSGSPTPSPATTPNPNAGQAPMTGFASRYTPAMLDQVYENPWYILSDVFNGLSTASPMYQALRDLGGDPLTLYNIAMGAQTGNTGGAADFTNWLAGMYGNQGQAGGRDFSAQQLLGQLFGQQKFGADAQNTLGQILGAGDMATQVRTLYNMARDVSNVALNPLAARGYQSALAQAGDQYGKAMMSAEGANTMNPSQWIAERMPWLTLGG